MHKNGFEKKQIDTGYTCFSDGTSPDQVEQQHEQIESAQDTGCTVVGVHLLVWVDITVSHSIILYCYYGIKLYGALILYCDVRCCGQMLWV